MNVINPFMKNVARIKTYNLASFKNQKHNLASFKISKSVCSMRFYNGQNVSNIRKQLQNIYNFFLFKGKPKTKLRTIKKLFVLLGRVTGLIKKHKFHIVKILDILKLTEPPSYG